MRTGARSAAGESRRRVEVAALAIALAACGRTSSESAADRRPQQGTGASTDRNGIDAAPGAHAGNEATTAQWRGSYHSESSTIFVPPEWKGVKWNVPPSSAGLGDGSMTLDVPLDASGGRVLGEVDGPLGPAIIDGVVSGTTVTATILRRDPADRGYSGTLVATIGQSDVAGTMNLSLGEASAVRTATFTLSRSP